MAQEVRLPYITRGQVVDHIIVDHGGSPLSLEVESWTMVALLKSPLLCHKTLNSGPWRIPIVTKGQVVDHGGSPPSLVVI